VVEGTWPQQALRLLGTCWLLAACNRAPGPCLAWRSLQRLFPHATGYFPVRIEAIPEGTCMHARVPVYQVRRPLGSAAVQPPRSSCSSMPRTPPAHPEGAIKAPRCCQASSSESDASRPRPGWLADHGRGRVRAAVHLPGDALDNGGLWTMKRRWMTMTCHSPEQRGAPGLRLLSRLRGRQMDRTATSSHGRPRRGQALEDEHHSGPQRLHSTHSRHSTGVFLCLPQHVPSHRYRGPPPHTCIPSPLAPHSPLLTSPPSAGVVPHQRGHAVSAIAGRHRGGL
jgi:hypothetical protein